MLKQEVLMAIDNYDDVDNYLKQHQIKKILLVCDYSIEFLDIYHYFMNLINKGIQVVRFSDFEPNPVYESVVKGVELFNAEQCDIIIAVGGGSSIDVAKCIKLYSNMDHTKNYLKQEIVPNDVLFMAIPTTAGTGSESTRYAVIYYNDVKQSITDNSCIPSAIVFAPGTLRTLPEYQRKATMMDALCHAIEAYWSLNSNDESKQYSKKAIKTILRNMEAYLNNDESGNSDMLRAANMAGKAINITQTTAGHAMCYKLTSLYGISHGHAAALCVSKLFKYMISNTDKCIDTRGEDYLKGVFNEIASAMECNTVEEAVDKFNLILSGLKLEAPVCKDGDLEILVASVNPVRLKNNPVKLGVDSICFLYKEIFGLEK